MAKPQLIFLGLLLAMTMWSTSAQQVGIVTLTLPANIFEVKAPKVGDSLQFIVNWTVSTNLTFRVHDTVKNVSCSVLYRTLSARISCFAVSTRSHYLVVNTAFPEPIKYTVDVRVNTKLNNYYTNRLISSDPVYRAATTFPVGTQCLNATYNSSLGFFFLPTLSTRRYELFSPYTFTVGGQSFKMTQFSWRSFLHPTDQDPYISYDETGEYIVFALKGENDTTPEDPLTGIQ
jgi:hypothetical protein